MLTIKVQAQRRTVLTLVERKSRFTYIEKLDAKTAKNVVINFFKRTGRPCETITFDNGKEFTNHQEITNEIGVKIYFANPYHSWERGLNENTNGLIRQYIPKNQILMIFLLNILLKFKIN